MLCNKTKELIAIGASITANCQPCLEFHIGKALESGAKEEEIIEAVEAAKTVRRGAIAKMDSFVLHINLTDIAPGMDGERCRCNL